MKLLVKMQTCFAVRDKKKKTDFLANAIFYFRNWQFCSKKKMGESKKGIQISTILSQYSISANTCQFPPLFLTWASKIHFLVELPGFLFLSCLACNRTILLELPFRYHLAWKHILSPICKQRYILTLDSSIHPLFSNMVCCLTTLLVTTSTVNSHYPCCAGH